MVQTLMAACPLAFLIHSGFVVTGFDGAVAEIVGKR